MSGSEARPRRDTRGRNVLSDRLSFNTITNYPLDLRDVLELYRRHDITHVALWREKIDPVGVTETRRMLDDLGLRATSICGWYDRDKSSVTIDDKRHSIDIAAELGAAAITLVGPGLQGSNGSLEDRRKFALEQAATLLEHGRRHGVELALEPIHPKLVGPVSCLNTVAQAIGWCEALGSGVGVELDVNNVWWDPDLERQIRRAAENDLICGVQLCDVPASGAGERAVMGDGIVDLKRFVGLLESVGYGGRYEIELIGQSLWDREPEAYMRQIMTSCADLLD